MQKGEITSPATFAGYLKLDVNTGEKYDITAMDEGDLEAVFSAAQEYKEISASISDIVAKDLSDEDFKALLEKNNKSIVCAVTTIATESDLMASAIAEVLPMKGKGGNTPVHNMDVEALGYVKRLAGQNPAVEKGLVKGIATYSTSSGQRPIDNLDPEDPKRKLLESVVLSAAEKSGGKACEQVKSFKAGKDAATVLSHSIIKLSSTLTDLTNLHNNQSADNKIAFNAMLIALTKEKQ